MRIALIEDHKLIQDTIKSYFNSLDDYLCEICSPSAEQFYKDFVKFDSPDIILLDIQLPGIKGHQAIPKIKHLLPESKILIFSNIEDDKVILEALKLGADGYIHKSSSLKDLKNSLDGQRASLSPGVAEKLINHLKGIRPVSEKLKSLTEREMSVLKLLSEGLSQKAIADQLFIGVDGIRYHTKNIYSKLEVKSNIEAIKIYLTQ